MGLNGRLEAEVVLDVGLELAEVDLELELDDTGNMAESPAA